MVLAYRAHRHNEIALHARMTSSPMRLVEGYLHALQEGDGKKRAGSNKFSIPRKKEAAEVAPVGKSGLKLRIDVSFELALFLAGLLSLTELFALRAAIYYPVSPLCGPYRS